MRKLFSPMNPNMTNWPILSVFQSAATDEFTQPFQTLGLIFAKPKGPVTKEQLTDAIYSIPGNDCDNEYIGQTKGQFDAHLKEHQKAVFFCKKNFIGVRMPS